MANSDGRMDWDHVISGKSSKASSPSGMPKRRDVKAGTAASAPTRKRRASANAGGSGSGDGGSRRPPKRTGGNGGSGKGANGKKKASWGKRIGLGIVFAILGILIVGAGAFLYMYATLGVPEPDEVATAQTTTVSYNDSTTEMGKFSEVNRTIIDTSQLPDYVGNAIVSSEDRTFWTNSGVDLKGIARALLNNLRGLPQQGASTLTQQYVERYFQGDVSGYKGKAEEAILAIKINREESKEEILGRYMNTIYFGRGTYGIEAAAQGYFGKSAKDLTVSEAAMLAGLIPSPSNWDPAVDPEQSKARWGRVLDLMFEDGWIDKATYDAAEFPQTIDPMEQQSWVTGTNGYLMQQVRDELVANGGFTEDDLNGGGLHIVTTIDKRLQELAIASRDVMPEDTPPQLRMALSAMDPRNGEILAEYAGSDYQVHQQNAVTQDIAMAGSTFKPFTLLAYLQNGGSLSEYFNGNSPAYFPGLSDPVQNDSNASYGQVNPVTATKYSINTAYVAMNEKATPQATMDVAVKAGLPEDTLGLDNTMLNVLGFASPHNIDLTRAFGTFATGGQRSTPHIVRQVTDSEGNVLYTAPTTLERVFEADDVSQMMPALESVVESGGTAAYVKGNLGGRAVAGKTGTSEEQKSATFAGFIPQMVTTVSMYMVGDDGSSLALPDIGGVSGFHGGDWPTDVWTAFMEPATENMEKLDFDWYEKPSVSTYQQAPQAPQAPQEPEPSTEPSTDPSPSPSPETPQQDQGGTTGGGTGGTGGGTGGTTGGDTGGTTGGGTTGGGTGGTTGGGTTGGGAGEGGQSG